MSRLQDDQTTGRAEELVSELKAIELWDAVYKGTVFPFWYDHIAFVSRQKRRLEIASELHCISDRNVDARRPIPNTNVSQGQSEETLRVVRDRRPPQNSHDEHRGKQKGAR
jgi:hypothetical protein